MQLNKSFEKKALTEKEAASYIGMSRSFLRHARIDGNREGHTSAPKFIKIGRAVRYPKEELDSWLAHFPRKSHIYEASQKPLMGER
ncbi:MAG: helix-turn-helix domain-containing protein [Rickettsiales bacterium]|nr:helix-turn-helix domain-containing protein [Rickettsiales bacterium]